MRLFSSILFALMAMVLPMSGVQHYFCTMDMAFVDGAEDCPVGEKDCCGEKGDHKPTTPECMVASKLLPNAEKSSPLQIPMAVSWSIAPVLALDVWPAFLVETVSHEKDRGSPDLPRLYLVQRRLLI